MLEKIFKKSESFDVKVAISLISLFPIFLLSGSAINNISIILIDFIFLSHIYKNKKLCFLKNEFFYLLIFLWIFLLFNSLISNNLILSLERSIGFLRFIFFTFAISYYFNLNNKKYLKTILIAWSIIFIIVSLDIIYEYFNGQNILGFKSIYKGRISSFLGDELKIGYFFLGLAFITTVSLYKFLTNNFALILLIFLLLISLIIGERSNFIKFTLITFLFLLFFEKKLFSIKKKIILLITFIFTVVTFFSYSQSLTYNRFVKQVFSPIVKEGYHNYLKTTQHGAHRDTAKKIFKDNIFFGSGLKTFRIESQKNKYENKNFKKTAIRASTHPHQIHWEILSETGLVGYMIFFGIFIYVLFKSFKIYFKNINKNNHLLLVANLFIFAQLLPIIPSGSFFSTYPASIFWLNFSFLIKPKKI